MKKLSYSESGGVPEKDKSRYELKEVIQYDDHILILFNDYLIQINTDDNKYFVSEYEG